MMEYLEIAKYAAIESSKYLLNQELVQVNVSDGKDIKLQADVDSEQIIFKILKENSDLNILSEEAGFFKGSSNSDLMWIVDPLDGSLNYSRKLPLNCISIALWNQNKPILGVIYDFNSKAMYSGVVGEAAWLNFDHIRVSQVEKKSEAIICTGFPVYSSFDNDYLKDFINEIQVYKKVRLLGTAALSLAYVAKGAVEAYKENNIAIWDVAAGLAIVKAAGGYIKYEFDNNIGNVYASNNKIE